MQPSKGLALFACCLLACGLFVSASSPVDATNAATVNPGLTPQASGTDAGVAERQQHHTLPNAEQFTFQAEVSRLMDILINSLYSNKDIFLRELISNASDALDKIRFLSLTDPSQLGSGDESKLEIRISLDKESRILSIRDSGVGMTKDDLIKNLGTIAKSGTSAFLEQMQKGGDVNLIGQFGVGFYSVYLVADLVEVVSKHNDDKQYVWSSAADGSFSVAEDSEGEALGRGTLIKLHLKPEALEYAEEAKLKELVSRYSEFINFPIYLRSEKEVDVPVEEEAEEAAAEEEDKSEEGVEDSEEESEGDEEEEKEEEAAPKKTRKEKRMEWDLLNDSKAIWLRKPKDVAPEEYTKFYKTVSKAYDEPLGHVHFKAEGDVEFKSVLFVPSTVPFEFYDKYYEKGAKHALKLYVRRVFISDEVEELLPRYLGFLRGIVDSDSLPLNVSREMLQQHATLKTIRKKLVRKVLDLIKKWADDEASCRSDKGEEEEGKEKPTGDACELYDKFWTQYGRAIKLGIIEDTTNRNRLAKLLRFHTSKSEDKLTSLDEYIGRMKEGQKDIYFLAGNSKEEVAKSPFVEQLLRKGYEVIYFTDVLDEYVMQHMLDYDDKKFANASREDLRLSDKDEEEKAKEKEAKEEYKDLTKWWKKLLASEVTGVKVSRRLATTPCVVVTGKFGQSANMERIMKAQAFADPSRAALSRSQRALEINPRHPMIKALKEKVALDEEDDSAKSIARLMYDSALLESGFIPEDTRAFSERVQSVLRSSLGVDADAGVEEEVEAAAAEAPKGEEAAAEEEGEKDVKDEL